MLDRSPALALLLVLGLALPATAAPQGELKALAVFPEAVQLRGAGQPQQLIVTGQYAGGLADLTGQAAVRSANPQIVRVVDGVVYAIGNGKTEITVEQAGKSLRVPVTVGDADQDLPIHFTNDIVPIFSKLGCNSGGCHGKASGQNGFKLSLLGFEPEVDYESLTREARGRRLFLAAPEYSLLLVKATGAVPHGGGSRLPAGGRDYQVLLRWIRAGAPLGSPSAPHVTKISVTPPHRLVAPEGRQQIAVTAHYSDGSTRDVTALGEYSSNDPELVTVSEEGLTETRRIPGGGVVMVRYLGQVAVFRATIPLDTPADQLRYPPPASFIDQLAFARLKELGLPASELTSDGEFLRRVSIDITGTLPTAAEARQFLADTDPKKRVKLVDELLARPAYASYFALKWGDILRNRRSGVVGLGGSTTRTTAFHTWLRDGLAQNKPYDQFVREVITASGEAVGPQAQPAVGWYNVVSTPTALVDDTAQAFLGTRIQCAQCHHHPYEKWSQDDYWGLAAFFARLQLPASKLVKGGGNKAMKMVALANDGKVTSPTGKAYANPRPLDGEELTVPPGQDPRVQLADWMTRPDNPFLARALVNRYWAHFLGRGIVDMPDDLRVTNPASNPQLLDALARDFVEHKFDLKHLIRTICASKTYQLRSEPNPHNARDKQNFARFYPRRLPAEVLYDAIDQVTAVPTRINGMKEQMRAIEFPDEGVSHRLLDVFGKPDRASACECERSGAATLAQSLFLVAADEIHGKLKQPASRAGLLAADKRPAAERVEELFLWLFARPPTAAELRTAEDYFKDQETRGAALAGKAQELARQAAWEDLTWALLNTKEFLFNH